MPQALPMIPYTACTSTTSGHVPASNFPQLPPEIWYKIAGYMDSSEIQPLYSVNSALLDLAFTERYREISVRMADLEDGAGGQRSILRHASQRAIIQRVERVKIEIERLVAETICPACGSPNEETTTATPTTISPRIQSTEDKPATPLSRLKRIFSFRRSSPLIKALNTAVSEDGKKEDKAPPISLLNHFPNVDQLLLRVDPWFVPLKRVDDPWSPILGQIYSNMAERLRSLVIQDTSVSSTYYHCLLPDIDAKPLVTFPLLEEFTLSVLEKPPVYDPVIPVQQSTTLEHYARFIQNTHLTLKKLVLRFPTPVPMETILSGLNGPFEQLKHVEFFMPHLPIWVSETFAESIRAFLRQNGGMLKHVELPSCWCRPNVGDLNERPIVSDSALPPVERLVFTGKGDVQALCYLMYYVHRSKLTHLHLPNMVLSYQRLELLAGLAIQDEEPLNARLETLELSVYAISPKLMYLLGRTVPDIKHLIIHFNLVLGDAEDEGVPHQNRKATQFEQLLVFEFALSTLDSVKDVFSKWGLKSLVVQRDSGSNSKWAWIHRQFLLDSLRRALPQLDSLEFRSSRDAPGDQVSGLTEGL